MLLHATNQIKQAGNKVHVWLQRDNEWKENVIQCPHGEGITLFDLDNDKDLDIVIGGAWYENDQASSKWVKHVFGEWHPSAAVKVADLNGDGKPDIVLTPAEMKENFYKISWFEQPDSPDRSWKEHVIQDSTEAVVHGIDIADFNKDGLMDIVVAEMHQGHDPDEVIVFVNQTKGERWEEIIISTKGSHLVQAVDIDADEDIDIIGANWSGNYQPIELWLNQTSKKMK